MRIFYNKDPYIKGNAKDLVEAPVVIRVGDITDTTATEFSKSVTEAYNTGQPALPIIVDSFGGAAYALLSILSDIETCKLPVITICVGKAMSAGAILLACGSPGCRFMHNDAAVMLHELSSSSWGKLSDIKVDVKEMDRLNFVIYRKMSLACGYKDLEYFSKLIGDNKNSDLFLNSSQAKKHKIIDYVGIPSFEVNINSKIDIVFDKPYQPRTKKQKKTRR